MKFNLFFYISFNNQHLSENRPPASQFAAQARAYHILIVLKDEKLFLFSNWQQIMLEIMSRFIVPNREVIIALGFLLKKENKAKNIFRLY